MTDETPIDLEKARRERKPVKTRQPAEKKPAAKPKTDTTLPRWIQTDAPTLPDDCPVVPLGRDARRYAFIDSNRQYVELDVQQFGSDGVADLFAHPDAFAWLWHNFPRFGKDGVQNGFDKERAKIALMIACARKGPFDFAGRVRGVGAWSDPDGRLHWHLGDAILVVEPAGPRAYQDGPLVHGYVYPRGARQPRPSDGRDPDRVLELYRLLQRWNWSRGELDARLVLGWICCALLGGALKWRAHMWVRGPAGSGKSTLQSLLGSLAGGDGAIVQASDASGAGIWTALDKRALPVAIDEMEARKGDTRHTENVINLARQAASGGRILRGGSNHTSHEFTAYSSFLFSSILVPPLEPQDLTRIGQVRLLPTPVGAPELLFSSEDMLETGRQLRRILVDAWPIWPRMLSAWRDAMIQFHQFDPRIADTWGTLLAMADMVLDVETMLAEDGAPPAARMRKWTDQVAPDIKRMQAETGAEWERLVRALLQHKLDPYQRGQRWTIETLVAVAARRQLPEDVAEMWPKDWTTERANAGLVVEGLKVVLAAPPSGDVKIMALAVQKRHSGLDEIFRHSKWKDGVYAQQFEAVPGAWSARQRFAAGKREPAIMVPVDQLLGEHRNPLEAELADRREDQFEIQEPPADPPPADNGHEPE